MQRNLLYVIVDDLRHDSMPRSIGSRQNFTTFAQAHSQAPLCIPSRQSFLSGRWPSRSGVMTAQDIELDAPHTSRDNLRAALRSAPTLIDLLNRANFVTAGVGKIFHTNEAQRRYRLRWVDNSANLFARPCDRRGVANNGSVIIWHTDARKHLDSRACPVLGSDHFPDMNTTSNALQLLDALRVCGATAQQPLPSHCGRAALPAPFALFVGYMRPHTPNHVPLRIWSSVEHAEGARRWSAWRITSAERIHPAVAFQDSPWCAAADTACTSKIRMGYYAAAAFFDSELARLLAGLQSRQLSRSTLVVVHADHGFALGEHGAWAKESAFDTMTHVPLAIRVPWLRTLRRQPVYAAVGLIDVLPTVVEALRLPIATNTSRALDGHSLLPLMRDADTARELALCRATYTHVLRHRNSTAVAIGYSVRTALYRLTRWEAPVKTVALGHVNSSSMWSAWAVGSGTALAQELYSFEGSDVTVTTSTKRVLEAEGINLLNSSRSSVSDEVDAKAMKELERALVTRSLHACGAAHTNTTRLADGMPSSRSSHDNRSHALAPLSSRIAYVHFPKTGSQFLDTLMHYANPNLPPAVVGTVQKTQSTYPLREWFAGIFWEKDGKIGNHHAVSAAVLRDFGGRLFGMFRAPNSRSHSMFNFFVGERPWISERDYAQRVLGSAVMMLSGQRYGLDCLQQGRPCPKLEPNTALALQRLDSDFAFVGLTEEWATSICLFHAVFGGECLSHEFTNSHATAYSHVGYSSSGALVVARPLGGIVDEADERLYARAAQRFRNDVAQHGVTPERCAREICPAARDHFALRGSNQ